LASAASAFPLKNALASLLLRRVETQNSNRMKTSESCDVREDRRAGEPPLSIQTCSDLLQHRQDKSKIKNRKSKMRPHFLVLRFSTALLALCASALSVSAVVITTDTLISPVITSFDGEDLIVSNCTV